MFAINDDVMTMMSLYSMQWVGSASGFAPVESMPDHVTLTKYNALVHRAQHLKQAKVWRLSELTVLKLHYHVVLI